MKGRKGAAERWGKWVGGSEVRKRRQRRRGEQTQSSSKTKAADLIFTGDSSCTGRVFKPPPPPKLHYASSPHCHTLSPELLIRTFSLAGGCTGTTAVFSKGDTSGGTDWREGQREREQGEREGKREGG